MDGTLGRMQPVQTWQRDRSNPRPGRDAGDLPAPATQADRGHQPRHSIDASVPEERWKMQTRGSVDGCRMQSIARKPILTRSIRPCIPSDSPLRSAQTRRDRAAHRTRATRGSPGPVQQSRINVGAAPGRGNRSSGHHPPCSELKHVRRRWTMSAAEAMANLGDTHLPAMLMARATQGRQTNRI
ncbi:hypothetical protein B2J93_77 [Marssonina coronariae]|uniref:Uncharacterized protein n=1 Tax=Diplocarpon coronariae TaxID=2795749 RepID=A0A218Z3V0_9HELO|nr:hypothetical protein B2J93_77 [Marssonina coronariae]